MLLDICSIFPSYTHIALIAVIRFTCLIGHLYDALVFVPSSKNFKKHRVCTTKHHF